MAGDNMTTVDNSKRYCSSKGVMCQSAGDSGYCNLTACTNPEVLDRAFNSMCSNCRYSWGKSCDKMLDPSKCNSWEPD